MCGCRGCAKEWGNLARLPLNASSKYWLAFCMVAGLKSARAISNHPNSGRENSPPGSDKTLLANRRPRARFRNKQHSLMAQRRACTSAVSSMAGIARSRSLIESLSILARRLSTKTCAMTEGSSKDFFFCTFLSHFEACDNSPTTHGRFA